MKDQNRYRFVIQAIICLVRICSGAIWASAGPLLPMIMAEFDISRGTVGWFASVAPLTITLLAAPIGIIGTRYSLKKTFALGAVLQAGGLFAPFCSDYVPLLLTRACFAIGTGITFPLIPAIASQWFTPREIPLVNGVAMGFNSLGNAIAYVATVPIAVALSWRAPMVIYGGAAVVTAAIWITLGKDQVKEKPAGIAPRAEQVKKQPSIGIFQALTHRSTILLALATMGCWGLGNSIGSWLPTYYHQVFGLPLETASIQTGSMTVIGIFASIAGGILPLRLGRRKPFLIIPGALLGLSALSAVWFNSIPVMIASLLCFGILSHLYGPSLFTIPFELPNMNARTAAVVAFAMLLGGNFGNFITPLLVGYLADTTGSFLPGFVIAAVMSLCLLLAGVLLPETGPNRRRTAVG